MKFSDNLRNLRKDKEYSQEYLAEVMGVSRQTVSKWENGSAMPDLKKLTELAELFETSMDSLLGIENAEEKTEDGDKIDIAHYNYYIQELEKKYDNLIERKEKEYSRKKRWVNLIENAFIIVLCIVMIFTINDIRSRVRTLEEKVETLQNGNDNTDGETNVNPEISDYVDCKLLKRNGEKPWLVTALFTYSPESYANSAVVKFNLDYKSGKAVQFEAPLDNGAFSAEREIDLTELLKCSIIIDDGSNTSRSEFDVNLVWQYVAFNGSPSYNLDCIKDKGKYKYSFVNVFTDSDDAGIANVYYSDNICGEIQNAKLLVLSGDDIVYSKDVQILNNTKGELDGNKYTPINSFIFTADEEYTAIEICLCLIDSKGVEYWRYLDLSGGNSTEYMYGMEYTEIHFYAFGMAEKNVVTSEEI